MARSHGPRVFNEKNKPSRFISVIANGAALDVHAGVWNADVNLILWQALCSEIKVPCARMRALKLRRNVGRLFRRDQIAAADIANTDHTGYWFGWWRDVTLHRRGYEL
jgi:hypothetical protein